MRLIWVVASAMAWTMMATGMSAAQDQPVNPDELNRKYQDALVQLKAAQDRKNELATENEKLSARVAELEKQLEESRRREATFAEQTFKLRSHYAAWQAFLRNRPLFLERWKIFIQSDPLALPSDLPEMADPAATLPAP